jgi:hypothetical protein
MIFLDKKFKIDKVDLESGVVDVTYFSNIEGITDTITYNIIIPQDKDGNYYAKEKLIDFVLENFPEHEFIRLSKKKTNNNYNFEDIVDKEFVFTKEEIKKQDGTIKQEENPLRSPYGNKDNVDYIKHIVYDVLESLGLIK